MKDGKVLKEHKKGQWDHVNPTFTAIILPYYSNNYIVKKKKKLRKKKKEGDDQRDRLA